MDDLDSVRNLHFAVSGEGTWVPPPKVDYNPNFVDQDFSSLFDASFEEDNELDTVLPI